MSEPAIYPIERLELSFSPKVWEFARARRAEIDAFFAEVQREKPDVWNGRVLLLHSQVIRGGVFSGQFLQTDYASFAAWRAWGRPPAGVRDCFGAAAIRASDGAFLLGVMAPHTVNAGLIYFPSGTPDPDDIVEGKVDLEASVWRELKEETGLTAAEVAAAPGWSTVVDGNVVAQIKTLHARETAETLRAEILAWLARENQPELADIRIVRGEKDFVKAMPRFVTVFLTAQFAGD